MNATLPQSGPGEGSEEIESRELETAPQGEPTLSPEALAENKKAEEAAVKRKTAGRTDTVRADVELERSTQDASSSPSRVAANKSEKGKETWWGPIVGSVSLVATKIKEVIGTLGKSISDGFTALFGKAKEGSQEAVEEVKERAKALFHELGELLQPNAPIFTFLTGKSPRITSGFGPREDPMHEGKNTHGGIDITLGEGNTDIGEPIIATRPLKVVKTEKSESGGNAVTLQDPANPEMTYTFRHLESLPPLKKGETLTQGQEIARVGNTGARTTGAHLHFEARKNEEKIDPLPYTGLA